MDIHIFPLTIKGGISSKFDRIFEYNPFSLYFFIVSHALIIYANICFFLFFTVFFFCHINQYYHIFTTQYLNKLLYRFMHIYR